MSKTKVPKMCLTCRYYEPYHCTLDDSYIGYLYVEEPTKCRAWELHNDYKKVESFTTAKKVGGITVMRKALRLVEKALSILAEDWGYIYGTSGQLWTTRAQEDLKSKYAMNPDRYKDYKLSAEIGDKWIGHHVADCSGLIVYLCKAYDVSVPHGSNSIWKYSLSEKGPINGSIPAGAVVLKARGTDYYHIGIYVGNDEVVEAQGTKAGVVKSKLDTWSHYGLLKDFDYTDGDLPELQPGQAVVDVPNDGTLKVTFKSVKPPPVKVDKYVETWSAKTT